MKTVTLAIPYHDNKDKPILIAINKIREYTEMDFAEVGILRDQFHEQNDIFYEIPIENVSELLERLKTEKFICTVIDH